MLQEPNIKNNKITDFYDANHTIDCFCPALPPNTPPKVCIIAKKSLNLIQMSSFDHQDMIVCRMNTETYPIWFVNLYMNKNDPNRNTKPASFHLELLTKVLQKLSQQGSIIVCMDSNCRSPSWGDVLEDARGKEFRVWLESTELVPVNNGKHGPTFRTRHARDHNVQDRHRSWIDITLTNVSGRRLVDSWRLGEWSDASDHCPIYFTIDFDTNKATDFSSTKRFNERKADWELFRANCRESWEQTH